MAVSRTKYGPTTIVRPTSTATAQGLRLGCFRRLTHVFLAPYAAPFSLIFTILCPRFEDKASLALRTLTRGNLFYHERKLFSSRAQALHFKPSPLHVRAKASDNKKRKEKGATSTPRRTSPEKFHQPIGPHKAEKALFACILKE